MINEMIQLGGPMMFHWVLQTVLFLIVVHIYFNYLFKGKKISKLFSILFIQTFNLFYCAAMVALHFRNHQVLLKKDLIISGNAFSEEVLIDGMDQWIVFIKFEAVYIVVFFISLIFVIYVLKRAIAKQMDT